jgi:hypothetical protein
MVFAMDMVSVGQETVGLFNHVGGEGVARRSADSGANKAANDTTSDGANAATCPIASASALANLDGRDDGALSMSYNRGKNHERERDQNRAQFSHGLPPVAYGAELFCS